MAPPPTVKLMRPTPRSAARSRLVDELTPQQVRAGSTVRFRPSAKLALNPRRHPTGPASIGGRRFEVPDGWSVQAFRFALDCDRAGRVCAAPFRWPPRKACNWAVAHPQSRYRRVAGSGVETEKPSRSGCGNAGTRSKTRSA